MAEENSTGSVPMEQRRMFRFLHSALAVVSLIWATVCLLIYFHAPSYQSQQLFDCRWHLSALAIQAALGHLFVFCSRTPLLFGASFLSTQYAVVYSMLTLIVYTMDTTILMFFPRSAASAGVSNFGPYLKLTSVFIVLSAFGVGLSLAHMRKLLQLGRMLGTGPQQQDGAAPSPVPLLGSVKTLRAVTGGQAALALLSIYVAASLAPMKFWYVRIHLVQEFSCSLLAISLALLQFLVFKLPNGGGTLLVKAIVLANACQIVQELNMSLSAFYTFFYVGRVYDAVEERQSLISAAHLVSTESAHIQLALEKVHHGHTVLAMNLVFHIGRMLLNGFLLWTLAHKVFGTPLDLRVRFKLDSEMAHAEEQWARIKERERKWLYSVSACVVAVAVGHVLLNCGYVWASMIFESLSVATGLSFVFSVALLAAVGFYALRLLRFCLVLSAYVSLNLLITACLLLFAFIQDFFFLATTLDESDKDDLLSSSLNDTSGEEMDADDPSSTLRMLLYLADFALSVGTFLIAGLTLRYAVTTLLKTKVLQTQPNPVQRGIRILRAFALVGMVSAAIEFLLLAELRLESRHQTMGHLSLNSGFYSWLLNSAQFIFLFYISKHERFQALLPVQILQLASVSITTLDIIGQQTETVQVYVNSVLQFYRITEALFRRPQLSSAGPGGAPSAVFVTHTAALTVPLHLFVDMLALHFLQVLQFFLTIAALAVTLYCADNMVEDESDGTNDFHELRSNGRAVQPTAMRQSAIPDEDVVPPCPNSSAPSVYAEPAKIAPIPAKRNGSAVNHFSNAAFDNQLYNMDGVADGTPAEEKEHRNAIRRQIEAMETADKEQHKEEGTNGISLPSSNESSPYKDINLHG